MAGGIKGPLLLASDPLYLLPFLIDLGIGLVINARVVLRIISLVPRDDAEHPEEVLEGSSLGLVDSLVAVVHAHTDSVFDDGRINATAVNQLVIYMQRDLAECWSGHGWNVFLDYEIGRASCRERV